jgi:RNA polymerase sigma factor (sigma-70 family)
MPSDEMAEKKPAARANCSVQEFHAFLERLSANREEAGRHYNQLRQKVVFYFENRGAVDAQAMADEVMDRVCLANAKDKVDNVPGFALGAARYVRLEYWRKCVPETERGEIPEPSRPEETPDFRLMFLKECLGKLPPAERQLILTYHEGEKSGKIAERLQIAEKLGLSSGAVRTRAHRIREKLEDCIGRAIKRSNVR